MTLAPLWRTRFVAVVAVIVAVWLGVAIAQEELAWPVLLVGAFAAFLVVRIQPRPLGTVLLGLVLIGYLVGNRGFAQISLSNFLPLLPAEFVLLVGGTLLAIRSAFRQELPWRNDALNLALLLWIVIGACRLVVDVQTYGAMALRDFATVYYAAFFFLAQAEARDPRSRAFLLGCLLLGCLGVLALHWPYQAFQDFFLTTLTWRGLPVIFFKGDLVGTTMAAGAVALFLHYEARGGAWKLAATAALLVGMLTTNNRASMAGLATATVLLLLARRWRFAALQVGAGVLAAVAMLLVAHLNNQPWKQTPLHGVYERVVSLTDPFGRRAYSGEETLNKGDNNRFRAVWWAAVYDETVAGGPWLGLGFGHNLAERFAREYYPDAGDEFVTRSPHNVLLTLFGRTGLAGLLPFLFIFAFVAVRTVQCARRDPARGALWAAAWVILVSACFGVVLEGPMGAVVFWSVLGLANAPEPTPPAEISGARPHPHLQDIAPRREVAASTAS
jgi:hypothetical protein